ncbi:hypothetical protein ZIOFF_029434 [Zingiber officinale]|uniref:Uncharacterized protein n=1 Tax=Zingiber officinale TaxID=94328 RepID=A0A8J5GPJ7_ZINOF|nr:hypothetical protein ZIOFF_029434 [Zingiber officinale]
MIKELTSTNAIKAADSKRITELEEIIRRKNMVNLQLKKDMAVLEKQVVELTMLQRRSSTTLESDSSSASYSESSRLSVMATNICFDMSSTCPSSSDPLRWPAKDTLCHFQLARMSPKQHCSRTVDSIGQPLSEHSISLTDNPRSQRSISPLKENRRLQRSELAIAFKQKKLAKSSEDSKSNRSAACQKGNLIAARRRCS